MDQWDKNLLINGARKLYPNSYKIGKQILKPFWKSICHHQIVKTGYCIIQKYNSLSNMPEKLLHIFIRAYVQNVTAMLHVRSKDRGKNPNLYWKENL